MTERITGPQDCALLLGIPIEQSAFCKALPIPDSYAHGIFGGPEWSGRAEIAWRAYEQDVGRITRSVAHSVRRLGTSVIFGVTRTAFAASFARHHVVTLFTHFVASNMRVELADGLVRWEDALQLVPPLFDGVIDLCMCESTEAGHMTKERCPDAVVLSNDGVTHPRFRGLLYERAIRLLAERPGFYTDALVALRKELARLMGRSL